MFYQTGSREDDLRLGDTSFLDVDWMKFMWLCLYAFQLLPALYVTAFVCRPPAVSRSLRDVISYRCIMSYDLGLCSLLAWTILKGQRDQTPHFNSLTLFGACVFLCIACSLVIVEMAHRKTGSDFFNSDVILIRSLLINGWSALATWSAIICLYDVAHVVHVTTSIDIRIVRYSWLGGVAALMVVLFVVDVFCSNTCFQFSISPFIVALLAYVSIIFNQSVSEEIGDVMKYVIYALIAMMTGLMLAAIGTALSRRRTLEPEPKPDIHIMKMAKDDLNNKDKHIYKELTSSRKEDVKNV